MLACSLDISGPLPLSTVVKRRSRGFPAAAGASVGFLPLRRPLRWWEGGESPDLRSGDVNRGPCGGAAEAGWPASSFCSSASSPPRRRLRRRPKGAGASPSCRCFFWPRRRAGGEWVHGRSWWWRCEATAAWWCGVWEGDRRRRPGSGAGEAWGHGPGRCATTVSDPARWSWWMTRLSDAFGLGAPLLHGRELRREFDEATTAWCCSVSSLYSPFFLLVV